MPQTKFSVNASTTLACMVQFTPCTKMNPLGFRGTAFGTTTGVLVGTIAGVLVGTTRGVLVGGPAGVFVGGTTGVFVGGITGVFVGAAGGGAGGAEHVEVNFRLVVAVVVQTILVT